jgi:hypothetical protein
MGSNTNTTGYAQNVPGRRRPSETEGEPSPLLDLLREKNPVAREEIEEAYERAADDAEITSLQGEDLDQKLENIDEVLSEHFDADERHMIGSFTRNTMVGPMQPDSDADVMYILDRGEYGHYLDQDNGTQNLLQVIKRKIETDPRYSRSEVSVDQSVVAVKYHNCTVEIVPAFSETSGDGYRIPNTYSGEQSWVRTNPRQYKNMFEATNQAHDGRLEQFVRMAKSWNENSGKPYGSYHLETMAYHHMRRQSRKAPPLSEVTESFFDHLPKFTRKGDGSGIANDPVYSDQRVDGYMSAADRTEARKKAQRAQEDTKEARRLERAGKTAESKKTLEELYGRTFNDE